MTLVRAPLRFLYRVLRRHYLRVMLALQFQLTHLVALAGVGLATLYLNMSTGQLWAVIAFSQVCVLFENVTSLIVLNRLLRPVDEWLRGERDAGTARAAWRALVGLPVDFVRQRGAYTPLVTVIPISAFIWLDLGLPFYSFPILAFGAAAVVLYGATLRYFAVELIARPVLEGLAPDLSDDVPPVLLGVSLRVKLLVAVPAINIVTGTLVATISSRGHGHLTDLGINLLIGLGVALAISAELTVALWRSIAEPIVDLHAATERVAAGDFSARVPVISGDETGALSASFNRMVAGLAERERLRKAFDTYVDPALTSRVLAEGSVIEGAELEVSVLFLDIRDFTAFAERASAAEVVAALNAFYELVVPVIVAHGGQANKFIGDGLLAVFGAPARVPDHADRAVSTAIALVGEVRRSYGDSLRIGIGVNSGPVVAGTVGGGGHLEFTVIGDPVNTASRVESVTRETGDVVLITEATHCLLTGDHGGFDERPRFELRGKSESVALYAPRAITSDTVHRSPLRPRT